MTPFAHPPDEISDAELMRRVQEGDETAFAMLVSRYEVALLAFAKKHMGDLAWAEDIVQETWIKVWANRHRFDTERPFKSWVFTIVHNKCRDEWRRYFTRTRYEDASAKEPGNSSGAEAVSYTHLTLPTN